MTITQKGLLAVVGFEIIKGFTPLFVKEVNPLFPTSLFAFTRHSITVVIFLGLILLNKKDVTQLFHLSRKEIFGMIALGLTGSGITALLYIYAVRAIGVSLSTIIGNLEIPFGIIVAALFLKEKLTKKFIALSTLILGSFFLIIAKPTNTINSSEFFLGIASILFCAILWGIATNLGKVLVTKEISTKIISLFRFIMGALFGLIALPFTVKNVTAAYAVLSLSDWLSLLYTSVIASVVGFLLYYKGLKVVEVKKISLFFTISTVISIMLGVFTGETLSFHQWLGAAGVLIGIVLLYRYDEKVSKYKALEEQVET